MTGRQVGKKGAVLEELLRSYFLCRGFFVVRSVPLRFDERDTTDIDLWLYERTGGGGRRLQICDIKSRQKPKAIERFFWVKGLSSSIKADGAFVATTDSRNSLRSFADRLDLQLIDGKDIARIRRLAAGSHRNRLDDEEFTERINPSTGSTATAKLQTRRRDMLAHLPHGFGAMSAVQALNCFRSIAAEAVTAHPDSLEARAAGRLSYFAGAIACVSLDYVGTRVLVASPEERRGRILDAIRLGSLSDYEGKRALDVALQLVSEYGQSAESGAARLEAKLWADLKAIPAEIVADQASRLLREDRLFTVARQLESACYSPVLPAFDDLPIEPRSMIGALLDYAGVERTRFAGAWSLDSSSPAAPANTEREAPGSSGPPRLASGSKSPDPGVGLTNVKPSSA